MSLSNYLEDKLNDHVWGRTTFTAPATVYISAHTADPGENGTVGEASGGSYARLSVANNGTTFATPSASGAKTNSIDLQFITATGTWGSITYLAIWDAASAGNCLAISNVLPTAKQIDSGDALIIRSGQATFSFD